MTGPLLAAHQVARYAREVVRGALRTGGPGMADESLDTLRTLLAEREVELDEVLAGVVREAAARLHADRATLYLVDHARQELVSHVMQAQDITEIRLRLGEGVAGWVARTGQVLNVPMGRLDPRFERRFDARSGYVTRSLLAAPVGAAPDPVIGVLQLLNHQGGTAFTPEDEQALLQVCARIATLLRASSLASQLRPGQRQALSWRFNHIIGESPPMQQVFERTARAARTDATVLIRGESGTGKELFARALHYNSARSDGPLVTVDCAALPAELIENELFGHERGAYTGADQAQEGKVQAAHGGTLFLDEVGDLPLTVQAKLLRLVQERTFFRVGGNRPCQADVRFVSATRRDLAVEVAAGRFREDLYYRLRVVELLLPPLRDRGHADLDRLIDHFLFEFSQRHRRPGLRLQTEARAALHGHGWPGNVRELRHSLEAAVVLAPDDRITVDLLDLGRPGRGSAPGAEGDFHAPLQPLRDLERAYIRHVLATCQGNRSEAARQLGIGRNTLLRKLQGEGDG
ncbi:sigma-54-dependent Fis family transcriptional regulator [Myxococcota bacterium]|nr:sigma-54-dependent Fis family transcriptional regulator [Myxococcota bacterium]